MSKYTGEEQHGYWYLHCTGAVRYTKNCHGMKPEDFFRSWTTIGWWHVRCELDWYRFCKQCDKLKNGPLQPIIA